MTSKDDNRFCFPAWGISLVLHGVVVGLALVFVAQLKPVLQEETFQWDVALTAEARLEPESNQAESVAASVPPPVKTIQPMPTKPMPELARPVRPTEQKVEPPLSTVEQASPIGKAVEARQVRQESIEQPLVAADESSIEPTVEPNQPEPVPVGPSSEPVAESSASNIPDAQEVLTQAVPPDRPVEHPSDQTSVAPVSSPGAKADYRWLAESLWRRVAELKRYPNSARMNGQEGKVVLKAVIRSDGQLADVFVQKSSGYSALDEAAMEAVRLACPLYVKHAIGKPQIVVSLPIVYSLAN